MAGMLRHHPASESMPRYRGPMATEIIAYVAVNLAREHRRKIKTKTHVRRSAEADTQAPKEQRKHPRINCLMEVDFVHVERFYKGMINNISTIEVFQEDFRLRTGYVDKKATSLDDALAMINEAMEIRCIVGGSNLFGWIGDRPLAAERRALDHRRSEHVEDRVEVLQAEIARHALGRRH